MKTGAEQSAEQPDWAYAEAPRRRRVWPWVVAFGIVVVLAVVAWFAAEAIARDLVTRTIRDEVSKRLSLSASHEVDVQVGGVVIPQLIGGSLDEVTVSSEDVPVGSFMGDVTVTAQDVPIRGGADMGGATATVALDEEQLRAMLSAVDGFPAETVGLDEPDVTMSTELQLFGVSVPVGVLLTPSADDGDVVFTPSGFQVAGAEIDAERLAAQFGVLADIVLRDWTVCLAQHIPAGVTITDVRVEGDALVADADVDGAIVTDPTLQATGTCE